MIQDKTLLHAKKRAKERYGLDLTEEIYDKFVKKIERGHAELRYQDEDKKNISLYYLTIKKPYIVVYRLLYDSIKRQIVTFLPACSSKLLAQQQRKEEL